MSEEANESLVSVETTNSDIEIQPYLEGEEEGQEQVGEIYMSSLLGRPPAYSDNSDNEVEEAYDALLRRKQVSVDYDRIAKYADYFTNDSMRSLLPSILSADGTRMKNGYQADEIARIIHDVTNLPFEAYVCLLLGTDVAKTIGNNSNVALAYALVDTNWLTYDDGFFYPIIKRDLLPIAKQITAGAEASERNKDKKEGNKDHPSMEAEFLAMRVFNMLLGLIESIMNDLRKNKLTFEELKTGYEDMVAGKKYQRIFEKYNKKLRMDEHKLWNTEWFKHYTGRSSLKKFSTMDKFCGIEVDTYTQQMALIKLRQSAKCFERPDFLRVKEKWESSSSENRDQPRSRTDRYSGEKKKKESIPDPDYVPRNINLNNDDDDYDDFNSNRQSSSRPIEQREASPPPMSNTEPFNTGFGGGFGGFGNPMTDKKEMTEIRREHRRSIGSDVVSTSEESEDTEGVYSDDDEETIRKRKEAKKQRKTEKDARKKEKRMKQTTTHVSNEMNRFAVSAFDRDETVLEVPKQEVEKKKKEQNNYRSSSSSSVTSESQNELQTREKVERKTSELTDRAYSELVKDLEKTRRQKEEAEKEAERLKKLQLETENKKREEEERRRRQIEKDAYEDRKRIEAEEVMRRRNVEPVQSSNFEEMEKTRMRQEEKMRTYRLEEEERRMREAERIRQSMAEELRMPQELLDEDQEFWKKKERFRKDEELAFKLDYEQRQEEQLRQRFQSQSNMNLYPTGGRSNNLTFGRQAPSIGNDGVVYSPIQKDSFPPNHFQRNAPIYDYPVNQRFNEYPTGPAHQMSYPSSSTFGHLSRNTNNNSGMGRGGIGSTRIGMQSDHFVRETPIMPNRSIRDLRDHIEVVFRRLRRANIPVVTRRLFFEESDSLPIDFNFEHFIKTHMSDCIGQIPSSSREEEMFFIKEL